MEYTLEEINNLIIERGYIPIDIKWNGYNKNIRFKDKDGYKYSIPFQSFKDNRKLSIVNTYNEFSIDNINNYIKIHNLPIKLISTEYINACTPLEFYGDCGHIFKCDWHHLNRRKYMCCPNCMKVRKGKDERLSQDYVNEYLLDNGYTLEDTYVGNRFPMKCKNPDNEVVYIKFANFKFGRRPKTNKYSAYELIIANYLDKNNIEFEYQYIIKDCKDERPLPFDFHLPKYNCLIEVDGEQHDIPIKRFGGIEKFKKIKKHDEIKNKYCKNHNIQLVRILYINFQNENYKNIIKSIIG